MEFCDWCGKYDVSWVGLSFGEGSGEAICNECAEAVKQLRRKRKAVTPAGADA